MIKIRYVDSNKGKVKCKLSPYRVWARENVIKKNPKRKNNGNKHIWIADKTFQEFYNKLSEEGVNATETKSIKAKKEQSTLRRKENVDKVTEFVAGENTLNVVKKYLRL